MRQLRPFTADDFPGYQDWYEDATLHRALGPMDEEWLEFVLSEDPPATFVLHAGDELLAVVGIARPRSAAEDWVVTDIAVNPERRGEGVGRKALAALRAEVIPAGASLIAYVEEPNRGAHDFFTALGWEPGEAPVEGMLLYRFQSC